MFPFLRHPASFTTLLVLGCGAVPAPARSLPAGTSCAAVQPDPSDTTIYDSSQLAEKPILRMRPPAPTYPPELRINGVEGDALFSVVIAATGLVEPTSVHATSSRSEF